MGNRPDPHDHLLFELHAIRRELIRLSMRNDHLDAEERAAVERLDRLHDHAVEVKTRRQLAGLIEKGADPSPYMNEIAASIGCRIVSLEQERAQRKIIPFRRRDNEAG